jgi:hypothetical protein
MFKKGHLAWSKGQKKKDNAILCLMAVKIKKMWDKLKGGGINWKKQKLKEKKA